MTISGNVPNHLVIGARTGFLAALKSDNAPWQRIAGVINMTSKALELVDLGGAPMPLEDKDGGPSQGFVERAMEIKPRNWVIKVGLSYNASQDDQTGELDRKVKGAAANFNRHMNKIVFSALDAGDGTTYGVAYDKLSFFNDSHLNGSQAVQDNNFALALSMANFQTNINLARAFTDEAGELTDFNYDLMVCSPTLEYTAAQITGNGEDYSTANRAVNPYNGRMGLIVSPYFGATSWACLATNESSKPMYLAIREQPALQDAWFDPDGPDGGTYWFKYFGRYNVVYGDYRLAFLGNS